MLGTHLTEFVWGGGGGVGAGIQVYFVYYT